MDVSILQASLKNRRKFYAVGGWNLEEYILELVLEPTGHALKIKRYVQLNLRAVMSVHLRVVEEENVVVVAFLEEQSRRELCLSVESVENARRLMAVLVGAANKDGVDILQADEEGVGTICGGATLVKEAGKRAMEGLLFKKSGDGTYRQYFFSLMDERTLLYFRDEASKKLDLVLGFLDVTQLLQLHTTGHKVPSGNGQELTTFRLEISHDRVWELGAPDPVDAMLWITQLTNVRRRPGAAAQRPSKEPSPALRQQLQETLSCFEGDQGNVMMTKGPTPNKRKDRSLTEALLKILRDIDSPDTLVGAGTSSFAKEYLAAIEADMFSSSEILDSVRTAIGVHVEAKRSVMSLVQSFEEQSERVMYAQQLKKLVAPPQLQEVSPGMGSPPPSSSRPNGIKAPRVVRKTPTLEGIFATASPPGGGGGSPRKPESPRSRSPPPHVSTESPRKPESPRKLDTPQVRKPTPPVRKRTEAGDEVFDEIIQMVDDADK